MNYPHDVGTVFDNILFAYIDALQDIARVLDTTLIAKKEWFYRWSAQFLFWCSALSEPLDDIHLGLSVCGLRKRMD